jgi:HK97 family phage portal protein
VANFLTKPLHLPWDGALTKAAALVVGSPRRGGYVGDPLSSGYWVDGASWGATWRGNGSFDYARAVGDPTLNAIVAGCLNILAETVPEPPLRLYKPNADEEMDALPNDSPAAALIRRPNPAHTWDELAALLAVYVHTDGNAYLWKERSGAARVTGLWPLPPKMVTAVPGGSTTDYVSHFAYKPNERDAPQRLETADVVHLTLIRDPDAPWKGLSPLRSVLKHIFTDEEATSFMNAMLKNYGVPGALISADPVAGPDAMSAEQAQRIKALFMATTGGDKRGEPVVVPGPLKINLMSFNPQQMLLDSLQATPEARICGALGVPPIMAMQKVGLDKSTYSNSQQAAESLTRFKLVPYWRLQAAQLTHQLLPDFYGEDSEIVFDYDLSKVQALQEDEGTKVTRLVAAVTGGVLMPNEARRDLGRPEVPGGDVLYIPTSVKPTEPDNLIPEPPPPPAPPVLPLPGGDGAALMDGRRPVPQNGQPRRNGAAVREVAPSQNGRAR